VRLRIRLDSSAETEAAAALARLAGLTIEGDPEPAPGPTILLCARAGVLERTDADYVLAVADAPVSGADDFIAPPLHGGVLAHRLAQSERVLAAERQVESLTPLRVALDLADEMMFRVDFAARIRDVNATACRRLGYNREELLRMSIRDLSPNHDPSKWADRWGRVAREGSARFESFQRGRAGDVFPVDVSLTFLDGHGRGEDFICSFVRDLSERKRMEANLLVADRLHALGVLAAETLHEMAQPIAVIAGCVGAAETELGRPDDTSDRARLHDILRDAADAVHRLRRTMGQLQAFSRGEAASTPRPVPTCLDDVVDRAHRMTSRLIEGTTLVERTGAGGVWVMGDSLRLVQVAVNLLINAQQAMPKRARDANRIRIEVARRGAEAHLCVRDNGEGIAPALLPRIFDPFFTTKPTGVGTGLGLSVSHGIVTGLGGRIEVESAPGVGTLFRVVLPAADPPLRHALTPMNTGAPRKQVLVVDDEIPQLRAMTRLLGRVAVVTATQSVDEALSMLETGAAYDLILCDLNMPSRLGTDLHAWLLRERPELVPAFYLATGGVCTDTAQRYLDTHQPQVMEKPLNTSLILKLLGAEALDAT
jgi:PAS domain S-box-containing protein